MISSFFFLCFFSFLFFSFLPPFHSKINTTKKKKKNGLYCCFYKEEWKGGCHGGDLHWNERFFSSPSLRTSHSLFSFFPLPPTFLESCFFSLSELVVVIVVQFTAMLHDIYSFFSYIKTKKKLYVVN